MYEGSGVDQYRDGVAEAVERKGRLCGAWEIVLSFAHCVVRGGWARSRARRALQLLCCATLVMSSAASFAAPGLGVYRWDAPSGPANIDEFGRWLGRPAPLALAFEARDTWDSVDGAGWQLGPWSQWVRAQPGRNLILSVPMLPGGNNLAGPDGVQGSADDLSLAKCGAGQYDTYWKNLANELAAYLLNGAYLRLGWEMDGGWYAWRAPPGQGNEANFASCFRRIVQVMRGAQPTNQWRFVWNPANAWSYKEYLDAAWPGDQYVDVVAIDLYDQSWATNTYPYPSLCDAACRLTRQQNAWNSYSWHLFTIRDFAKAHGKPVGLGEWGVTTRSDGHGGGDNPYYVQKMYDFIMNSGNNVAFHAYFDVRAPDGDHQISPADGPTQFPNSAELFKKLFGVEPAPTPTPEPGPAPGPAADSIAPSVVLTSPPEGTLVSRRATVSLEASASDNVGVVAVEFFVNERSMCRVATSPYRCTWSSGNKFERSYTIKANAMDAAGNSASSSRTYYPPRK